MGSVSVEIECKTQTLSGASVDFQCPDYVDFSLTYIKSWCGHVNL